MKRHMNYIRNTMNRPGLTTDQYQTYLLSNLIRLSGAENSDQYAPSFDQSNLTLVQKYFRENRRDIME